VATKPAPKRDANDLAKVERFIGIDPMRAWRG
jgi:hypothetical protein